MKPIYALIMLALVITSCKKEIRQSSENISLEKIRVALKDSMLGRDYDALDFTGSVSNRVDSVGLYFLRMPFKGKRLSEEFVLIKLNRNGSLKEGKIIQLNGGARDVGVSPVNKREWEGSISISSLNRKFVMHSPVHEGYIQAFHQPENAREQLKEADALPEVVIITYVNATVDYSTFLWLNGFFHTSGFGDGDYGSTGGGGYYGSIDGGGGYSGGGGFVDYDVQTDETLELEPEYMYAIPGVDLNKVFKCFDYVPGSGASYSIKLCADIPSNSNPNASSTSSGVSAGHTFLIVTKTNGAISVTQSFGFYPASAPSWLDPFAPVASSIKDNGAHEINASIEMAISESQFNTMKQNALSWSARQYELSDYNCTNYAMDVFNSIRTDPITVNPYKVILPGDANPWAPSEPVTISIGKSPQMLFTKLQQMKTSSSEASKIRIDQTHSSVAPISKGECN